MIGNGYFHALYLIFLKKKIMLQVFTKEWQIANTYIYDVTLAEGLINCPCKLYFKGKETIEAGVAPE